MSTEQRALSVTTPPNHESDQEELFRDIHALTPPQPANPIPPRVRRPTDASWETSSHRSTASDATLSSSENFTTISREFNALVLAGSAFATDTDTNNPQSDAVVDPSPVRSLEMIGEGDEETNPLAIVLDSHPLAANNNPPAPAGRRGQATEVASVHRVKKDEVEAKISAWQTAKVAKVNNRFKREDAVINGWENEQVQQATSWMKKIERKLEEKRAKAMEKMQNDIARAHRKAEERRASAEAKRGTKVARVLEVANLMRAVGKAPTKRSFF